MSRRVRTSALAAALFALATGACRSRIDVGAMRGALAADSRGAFDLVVALHGLDGDGKTDWGRAEHVCASLKWPRCDRQALEAARRASGAGSPAILTADARMDPVAMAARAAANAIWAIGSEDAARKMFRAELDRIPESDGPERAHVFLRFAIIDTNFDGQAALFAQACAADARLCDREPMKVATQYEVKARLVAPGNVMPLYFVGHPRAAGPP